MFDEDQLLSLADHITSLVQDDEVFQKRCHRLALKAIGFQPDVWDYYALYPYEDTTDRHMEITGYPDRTAWEASEPYNKYWASYTQASVIAMGFAIGKMMPFNKEA